MSLSYSLTLDWKRKGKIHLSLYIAALSHTAFSDAFVTDRTAVQAYKHGLWPVRPYSRTYSASPPFKWSPPT